jgi:hypothetical protein
MKQKGTESKMDMKLELVLVPVADVDRAKAFYVEKIEYHADHDVRAENGRVIQLTPPGSACSIVITVSLPDIEMQPGSLRSLHLVIKDIHMAREALAERGTEVSEVDEPPGLIHPMCKFSCQRKGS